MADNSGQNSNPLPMDESSSAGDDGGSPGAPAWMATFADLVTLLMCFFVLLFAMSTTQQETFKELVKSMKSALGVQQIPEAGTREGLTMHEVPPETSESEDEIESVDELGAMVQKEINEIVSDVRELIMFNRLGGMVKVHESDIGPVITISDILVFEKGKSDMSREGLYILKQVADILKQFSYNIKVAGHTDSIPINSARFESNWELSSSRASKIVRYLEEKGVDPKNLSAIGFAHYRPIATNDTEKGRTQNRRVEIFYERNDMMNSILSDKEKEKKKEEKEKIKKEKEKEKKAKEEAEAIKSRKTDYN